MLLWSGAGSGGAGHGRYRSQCCARYPSLSIMTVTSWLGGRGSRYIILCTHTSYDTTYLPVEYDTIGIV